MFKSQNSYDPSAKLCRIKSWMSKHICVISCRFVELGLATNNIRSQNSYESSVVACRINSRVGVTDHICVNSCRIVESGTALVFKSPKILRS